VLLSVQFSISALDRDDTPRYMCVVFCADPLEKVIIAKKKKLEKYSSFETECPDRGQIFGTPEYLVMLKSF